jgi:hypothetical protein
MESLKNKCNQQIHELKYKQRQLEREINREVSWTILHIKQEQIQHIQKLLLHYEDALSEIEQSISQREYNTMQKSFKRLTGVQLPEKTPLNGDVSLPVVPVGIPTRVEEYYFVYD